VRSIRAFDIIPLDEMMSLLANANGLFAEAA